MKRDVQFLKVDQGLAAEKDGVQLMKSMPTLDALLDKARAKRIFGTKMRSVIKHADESGIKDIVLQQFELGQQIISSDLMPILEPEIDIHCPEKAKAEQLLKAAILEKLNELPGQTSKGREGGCPLRRLFARRSKQSSAQTAWRDRQLFPRSS